MNYPFTLRPATAGDTDKRAKQHFQALIDGNEQALLAFAEHLAEEGELGDVPDLSLDMTVRQLVTTQLTLPNGRASAKAWAKGLAEAQLEDADFMVPA